MLKFIDLLGQRHIYESGTNVALQSMSLTCNHLYVLCNVRCSSANNEMYNALRNSDAVASMQLFEGVSPNPEPGLNHGTLVQQIQIAGPHLLYLTMDS